MLWSICTIISKFLKLLRKLLAPCYKDEWSKKLPWRAENFESHTLDEKLKLSFLDNQQLTFLLETNVI